MIPEMIPDLRFDARDILATLEPWVLCESPTHDAAAVNRMMGVAARDLALLGATVETIPGRMGLSDCVRARFPHRDRDAPGILVLGHLDTVHPVGTLGSLPWRIEGDRAYGPGILDMKGGNVVALAAIRALAAAGIETPLPVTVLFTGDEEVGSPSTRDLIEAEAATPSCWCPNPASPRTGSSPGATPSPASSSRPWAARATPAPRPTRGARRSARWRGRSSPSTRCRMPTAPSRPGSSRAGSG